MPRAVKKPAGAKKTVLPTWAGKSGLGGKGKAQGKGKRKRAASPSLSPDQAGDTRPLSGHQVEPVHTAEPLREGEPEIENAMREAARQVGVHTPLGGANLGPAVGEAGQPPVGWQPPFPPDPWISPGGSAYAAPQLGDRTRQGGSAIAASQAGEGNTGGGGLLRGAVIPGYLRDRLDELRRRHSGKASGRVALNMAIAERTVNATAELLLEDEQRRGHGSGRSRRRSRSRGRRSRAEDGSEAASGSESGSGTDYGLDLDTKVRRLAARRPGALALSTLQMMLRQLGDNHAEDEASAAVGARGLATAYLTRVLGPQSTPTLPLRAERELRTLAEAVDSLMTGKVQVALDILAQRFRAVETSLRVEGGWALARHLEVIPEARAGTVTQGLRAVMADAERRAQRLSAGPPRRGNEERWKGNGWKTDWNSRELGSQRRGEPLPSALDEEAQAPARKKGKAGGKGKKGKKN